MLKLVRPNLRLNSVLELEVGQLRKLSLQTLLLDVDCTLKDYRSKTLSAGVPEWIAALQSEGIRLCLLSNGRGGRIGPLAKQYGLASVTSALKPFPFGCWKALRTLGADADHTAVVGDQIFADVLAGRLAGLFTILVRPTTTIEPWFTQIKRPLERRLLARMEARNEIATLPKPIETRSVELKQSSGRRNRGARRAVRGVVH